jgi:predicted SprT family Zn-dependent metalloprotease
LQSQSAVFEKYLPAKASQYCFDLWVKHGFTFKIVRGRSTKLGDFRFNKGKKPIITVNQDLNPYAFTVTYLHEVAHLQAFEQYGRRIAPHGPEWKNTFKAVLLPVVEAGAFPDDLAVKLRRHLANPKAASCSDPALMMALSRYDEHKTGMLLAELRIGEEFLLEARHFKKEGKKRTRSVCLEMKTGRKYLISEVARVEKLG